MLCYKYLSRIAFAASRHKTIMTFLKTSIAFSFRLLFWVDALVPKIEKSDLSGSSRGLLVTRALYWPTGITADLSEQRLYWTDYIRDSIESVSYTGDDRRFIRRVLSGNLYDIAIYKVNRVKMLVRTKL